MANPVPTGNTDWATTQTNNGPGGAPNREPYEARLEEIGFYHGEAPAQSDINEWMHNVGAKLSYCITELSGTSSETGSDILIEITNSMTWNEIQEKIDVSKIE